MKLIIGTAILLISYSTGSLADDTALKAPDPIEPTQNQASQQETIESDFGSLQARMVEKFNQDKTLDRFDIQISFQDTTAHLHGAVNTDSQFMRAVAMASAFEGVEGVNTENLKAQHSIESKESLTLKGLLHGKLLKENFLLGASINKMPVEIEAHQGDVTVTGEVSSPTEANRIFSIVQSTDGVNSIKTNFTFNHGNSNASKNEPNASSKEAYQSQWE